MVRVLVYGFLAVLIYVVWSGYGSVKEVDEVQPLPEFTQTDSQDWINSKPLSVEDLEGKVVLLDFWTFECWNCYRSFPWINALHDKYHEQGFEIVGVHSPEFEHEKNREKVAQKVKEFELKHPVMIDNDFVYWRKLKNRFWPTFYVVDKKGRVRGIAIGETHVGDTRAKRVEGLIEQLLAET